MTLGNTEISRICRGLALLLHSGIGAADGAFLLAQEEQAPLKTLLNDLGKALDGGMTLGDAMEKTGGFSSQICAMVRVGEETGHLEEALLGLASYHESRSRTANRIRSAVTYPALVMVLMLLVVGVLLVKVLPVFDRVYASLGSRLTGPAAALLYAGELLNAALPVLFVILLILAAGAVLLWLRPALREKLTRIWKRRWGDRGLARKFNNAHFISALAMALSSGLLPEQSIALGENLLQDVPEAAERCRSCVRAMEAGASFGSALESSGFLQPAQCHILQIAQRSGNADQVMQQIADSAMEEAENALDRSVASIEPVMVLISSLLVGLILLSVMLPLADILSVLG